MHRTWWTCILQASKMRLTCERLTAREASAGFPRGQEVETLQLPLTKLLLVETTLAVLARLPKQCEASVCRDRLTSSRK